MLKKYKNYFNFKLLLIKIFVISFFLPNFDVPVRFDHLVSYAFITIFSFICFITIYKNRYNFKLIVINIKKNIHLSIGMLLFIAVLICLTLSTIISYFQGIDGFLIDKNEINLLASLSILDNYLLNFSIFILCLFLFYKNSDYFFNYFLYLIILMLSINTVYTIIQTLVITIDKDCNIFTSSSQTIFCDAIAWIDRIYSNNSFSNALVDYISRNISDPNIAKENLNYSINSSSIGWISLSVGRAGGIFNMPVESATINSAGVLLIFILFFNDNKDSLKKISIHKQKFYIYSFFLILLSSILNVSKITSHFTLPAVFLLILLNRKKLKYFIFSNYFKFSLFTFVIILVLLFNLRWVGFNSYYTHIAKYINIICSELKTDCKLPQKLFKDKHANTKLIKNLNFDRPYEVISDKKQQTNQKFDIFIEKRIKQHELVKKIDKKSKTKSTISERFKLYLYYITGGRFGGEKSNYIQYLDKNNFALGYGILIQKSFDNFKYYITFYSGKLSYNIFLIFIMIPFIFIIFYKKKFNNDKLKIVFFFIFGLYLFASLGGPIYFMNRVSVVYYAIMAFFLIKLDANSINKNNA